jgi:uncharacterized beta-barrel protein YwiB (DUF1934 family)
MSFNEYDNKDLKKVIICLLSEIEEHEAQKGIDFVINYENYKIDRQQFTKWWEKFKRDHNHKLLVESAREKLSEAEWEALEDYYDEKFHPM